MADGKVLVAAHDGGWEGGGGARWQTGRWRCTMADGEVAARGGGGGGSRWTSGRW